MTSVKDDKVRKAVEDEIEAIRWMYCQDGEFFEEQISEGRQISLNLDINGKIWNLKFLLSEAYPDQPPRINVYNTEFSRKDLVELNKMTEEYGQSLSGSCMIIDIVSWFPDKLMEYKKLQTYQLKEICTEQMYYNTLLQVHHMRAKEKYIKNIRTWMRNFDLTGRILFYKKFIYIVLQGKDENTKKFLREYKTNNVDVDSKGQPCKERMTKTLSHTAIKDKRMENVFVEEFTQIEDMKSFFNDTGLQELWCEHVRKSIQ
ncbi:DgyrCDS12790 [Dimorphilus gyrociliatus]|uniref:RWD domain-containing protein 3 n=1 Tax=Dimorphilus gyrociliatus TaxID=2664684 RepID=A0A7I8W8R5_9ANNE|nr:DgyrCDS12790 [Dimorphilus gyrociliatus]